MILREVKNRYELMLLQPFRWFVFSGIMATFGTGLIYITLSWYTYHQNQSLGDVALLMFFIWAPSIVFGPLFGVCADRYNRKGLIILSNSARGTTVLIFATLLLTGFKPDIYYLAAILGFFIPFYMPAAIPAIKDIIPENRLTEANATIDMLYEIGTVAGMSLSGFLILHFHESGTLLVSGVCLVLSALCTHCMHYDGRQSLSLEQHQNTLSSFFSEYMISIKFLSQNKHLIKIYSTQTIIMIILMTIMVLLVPFARTVFNATIEEFATFEILFSVGVFLGGFAAPLICKKLGNQKTLMILLIILSTGLLLFAHNTHLVVGYFIYSIVSFGLSSWAIAISEAQIHTPSHMQGRLQATFYSIGGIGVLLIYLFLVYDDAVSLKAIYTIQGAIALLACLGLCSKKQKPIIAKESA